MTRIRELTKGGPTTHIAAVLVALPWALNAAGEAPTDTRQGTTVTFFGNRWEWSPDRQRVRIVGNARLLHADVEIAADRLWVDTGKKIAAASGNVRVTAENGLLAGDEFVYCFDTGSAFLSNASAQLRTETDRGEITAYFVGRELRYDGATAYIIDGSFTTCETKNPDYRVYAKELKLDPEGTLTARRAQVALYHIRLPRAPTVRIHMGGDEEGPESLAPGVGISTRDGFYASVSTDLTSKSSRPAIKADGRLSAVDLFRGRIYAEFAGNGRRSVNAIVGLNEDVQNEVTRNLVIDRLPELAAAGEWDLDANGRSAWYANLAVGNYRESPGRAEAWRESGEVGVRHGFPLGDNVEGTVDLSFRKSFYDSGGSLGVTTARLGTKGTIGRRFRGSARYVRRFGSGESPFQFDDIDIENELFTRFAWSFGQWGIGATTRYDIADSELRRAQLGLSKVVHCIQYGVSYDTVLHEVGLRVSLPGL